MEQEELLLNGALDRIPTKAQQEASSAELFAELPEVDEDIIMVTQSDAPSVAGPEVESKDRYTSPTGKEYKKKVSKRTRTGRETESLIV